MLYDKTLNDCSLGKHLFCFPQISMIPETSSQERTRFWGNKTDVSPVSSHYVYNVLQLQKRFPSL